MLGSVELALLEWVVPVILRVQLDLDPASHLLPLAVTLAMVGGLLFAAAAVTSRASIPTMVPLSDVPLRRAIDRTAEAVPFGHRAPTGGVGPRAPSA